MFYTHDRGCRPLQNPVHTPAAERYRATDNMKKLFQTLFGKRESSSRSQADNALALNDVLARYREPAKRPEARSAAAPAAGGQKPRREKDATGAGGSRELTFDLDDLAIAEERKEGFNPYDTGRFSTAELWEKRHRNRLT